MKVVEFSSLSRRDIIRLRQWLEEYSESVAQRAIEQIFQAASSLAEHADRGRRTRHGMRELMVPFGAHGYVIQYRVEGAAVVIVRIRHSLERR